MTINIAIHHRSGSFSEGWLQYCIEHGIDYKIVNCYDSRIIGYLKGIDGLLWHWVYYEPVDLLIARQIIQSVNMMGISVFPNIATCWHFDDKIGQKYLLESIEAPLIPTYIFFDKHEAMAWIDKTEFPKVFKLRCGAGSQNVKLIKTRKEAAKLCEKAFSKGFNSNNSYFSDAKTKIRNVKNINEFLEKLKRMPKVIAHNLRRKHFLQVQQVQYGYIYFQDFLPNNNFDTRITVIGNRAFVFTRNIRPNDFRASGSGDIHYNLNRVDKRCIKIAFDTAIKLKTQSLAFDFLFDRNNNPKIAEVSYCYQNKAIYNCPGHWDKNLTWHSGHMWPEDAIIEDIISEIYSKKV